MDKTITIIVPVYKVEKKVGRCIKSIQAQTYSRWKLILVNDASPDSSLRVCRRFATKDGRIAVVDKIRNEGVDKARFTGLEYANTEFVTFVNSDDSLRPMALERMLAAAVEDRADVVEMGIARSFDRRQFFVRKSSLPRRCISQPELMDEYYISFFGCNRLGVNMCGKLYRTELIRKAGLRPTGYAMGEDLFFNLYLFPHIRRYSQTDYVGYVYNWGGIISGYNPAFYDALKAQFLTKVLLLKEHRYRKGEDYVRIEMKNILKTHIQQLLQYRVWSRERVVSFVADELCSTAVSATGRSFYEEITALPLEKVQQTPFFQALYEKDAEGCVRLAEAELSAPRARAKRCLIRCLSLLGK